MKREMEGAAQNTPVEEGFPETQRTSKRVKGKSPSILDLFLKTAALKNLSLGTTGGRDYGN